MQMSFATISNFYTIKLRNQKFLSIREKIKFIHSINRIMCLYLLQLLYKNKENNFILKRYLNNYKKSKSNI